MKMVRVAPREIGDKKERVQGEANSRIDPRLRGNYTVTRLK